MPHFMIGYVVKECFEMKLLKRMADSCRIYHSWVHEDGTAQGSAFHSELGSELEASKIAPVPYPWTQHFFHQSWLIPMLKLAP